MPFTDTLTQVPAYAKFLKDVITGKRTIPDLKIPGRCNTLKEVEMLPKFEDPGSFTIPCMIGRTRFDHCLADLGASTSIMPYSVYTLLGLKPLETTQKTLELADNSIWVPKGKISNVPVLINGYCLPCDFAVMDMGPDSGTTLIFGRPFLATAGVEVEVRTGKMTLNFDGKTFDLSLKNSTTPHPVKENCIGKIAGWFTTKKPANSTSKAVQSNKGRKAKEKKPGAESAKEPYRPPWKRREEKYKDMEKALALDHDPAKRNVSIQSDLITSNKSLHPCSGTSRATKEFFNLIDPIDRTGPDIATEDTLKPLYKDKKQQSKRSPDTTQMRKRELKGPDISSKVAGSQDELNDVILCPNGGPPLHPKSMKKMAPTGKGSSQRTSQ